MFNTNPTTKPFAISSPYLLILTDCLNLKELKKLSTAITRAGVWISKDFLPCITGFPIPAGEHPTTFTDPDNFTEHPYHSPVFTFVALSTLLLLQE